VTVFIPGGEVPARDRHPGASHGFAVKVSPTWGRQVEAGTLYFSLKDAGAAVEPRCCFRERRRTAAERSNLRDGLQVLVLRRRVRCPTNARGQ
jgi:hypothetical protein